MVQVYDSLRKDFIKVNKISQKSKTGFRGTAKDSQYPFKSKSFFFRSGRFKLKKR